MKPNRCNQQAGFVIVAAVFIIILVGAIGAIMGELLSRVSHSSAELLNSTKAFYLAEAGLQRGVASQLSPTLSERVACSGLSGNVAVTGISLDQGAFSAGQSTISPTFPFQTATLSTTIGSADTVIPSNGLVTGTSTSYAPSGRILIDREAIDYTGVSGNDFIGLTRGADGTMAASHANGASISQFQCNLIGTGGVPDLNGLNTSNKRQVQQGVQMQAGWAVAKHVGTKLSFSRWGKIGVGPSWQMWQKETGIDGSDLNAISMLNYYDGWTVGTTYDTPAQWGILRLDAANDDWVFQNTVTPATVGARTLFGVSAVSSQEAWAVGEAGEIAQGGTFLTLLRWDQGTHAWCLLDTDNTRCGGATVPNLEAPLNDISMLDTSGNGYADIGFAVGGGKGIILDYNGTTWSEDAFSPGTGLSSVFVVSSQEAWAVGGYARKQKSAIFHWNGVSWSAYAMPTPPISKEAQVKLAAIYMLDTSGDGLANYGWIVGETNDAGKKGIILYYNNGTWSEATLSAQPLSTVAAFNQNDAWAMGDDGDALHWDGSTWTEGYNAGTGFGIHIGGLALIGAKRTPQSNYWKEIFKGLA